MTTINPIRKLLVANRGEIAIRVFRAATELNIRTVAVYTYEDRYSLHRYKADEAYRIGSQEEPLKPYLDIDEIVALAKAQGVDAIHPGYGFLSENVDFVRACEAAGIRFVGPRPEAMEALGDKVKAKALARRVSVPVIEDNKEDLDTLDVALKEADAIGYPVLLKAAAGGGGRGMRVVRSAKDLEAAFTEAKSEAGRAFGDDTLFLEKYVEDPKHIEVQILGDATGKIVHLYERDCSVQRRFQKLVEVAPAASLSEDTREQLYRHALSIANEVKYLNAGTVEFLVDSEENVYFIEVNPRIQVEHTVTEEVTGIDLVRAQILIADGHPLSHPSIGFTSQEDVQCRGFAVQCRVTAEDPANDFAPDFGRIAAYRSPGGFGIRLDAGSAHTGAVISPFFDSLLVKVTATGRTLQGAAERLSRALQEFRVRGIKTNTAFLRNVIAHKEFVSGNARVTLLEKHPELFQTTQARDRATKLMKYLAEVVVNGHPDIKPEAPRIEFTEPVLPAWDTYAEVQPGTKQKLDELGPEKFAKWLREEKTVHYTDTTLRDAHQSLLATRVRTIDMIEPTRYLAKHCPEIFSLEVWGGATFDVCLRFLHESPWWRLRELREAVPNILLQMLLRGSNAVGYSAYADNLIEEFVEESWKSGVDVFRIFDSMNWLEAMRVSIKAVRERTGGLAEVCLCYTGDICDESRTKYNLQYYLDLAREIEDAGAHIIAIKDMAGLLKPDGAALLVSELRKAVDLPIHLHTHDTPGGQFASYMEAIDAGVDVLDVALASMSGLTSQPNFNSLVKMLERHERAQQIDVSKLDDMSNYWQSVREVYYSFESGLKAGTAEVYWHEIPGGQYSNLRPQARALGLDHKFEQVKRNYATVNKMLGDVIKVTPSSKVVGDFALFMTANDLTEEDIYERGSELSFPESLVSLFRGDLGQAHGGFPAKLQEIVLKGETPYTNRPNEHIEPVDIAGEFEKFKQEFGSEYEFCDFLAAQLYPKVFKAYAGMKGAFGEVRVLPSVSFFYGLKLDEEILVEIDDGKTLILRLVYVTEPDETGVRMVHFKLNGQSRAVEVRDNSVQTSVVVNRKVGAEGDIGSPLQGKIANVLVDVGASVEKDQPLFVVEAMKMETTVMAPSKGTVSEIALAEGALVEAEDLVLVLS